MIPSAKISPAGFCMKALIPLLLNAQEFSLDSCLSFWAGKSSSC